MAITSGERTEKLRHKKKQLQNIQAKKNKNPILAKPENQVIRVESHVRNPKNIKVVANVLNQEF